MNRFINKVSCHQSLFSPKPSTSCFFFIARSKFAFASNELEIQTPTIKPTIQVFMASSPWYSSTLWPQTLSMAPQSLWIILIQSSSIQAIDVNLGKWERVTWEILAQWYIILQSRHWGITHTYQAYYTSFHCSYPEALCVSLENRMSILCQSFPLHTNWFSACGFSYQAYYTSVGTLEAVEVWCLV